MRDAMNIIRAANGEWLLDWLNERPGRQPVLHASDMTTGPSAQLVSQSNSLPWRSTLETWPDQWREEWGHRTAAYEDRGLSWREAEEQAFNDMIDG